MRAMSLAAEDGGDEQQNELRTLHSQLEITIKMVETLSRQLSDLKDQVCLIFFIVYPFTKHCHFYLCIIDDGTAQTTTSQRYS